MDAIPLEADQRVVSAEIDTREMPGMSRTSVRISVNAARMVFGISPSKDSVMVVRSVGVTSPMIAARRDRKGTAEIMTKKDACAA